MRAEVIPRAQLPHGPNFEHALLRFAFVRLQAAVGNKHGIARDVLTSYSSIIARQGQWAYIV